MTGKLNEVLMDGLIDLVRQTSHSISADRIGVSQQTIRSALAGQSLSRKTIDKIEACVSSNPAIPKQTFDPQIASSGLDLGELSLEEQTTARATLASDSINRDGIRSSGSETGNPNQLKLVRVKEPTSNEAPIVLNKFNRMPQPDALLHEVFIPVVGFVWMSDIEVELINHPSFQRLRRVKQLGLASVVYPGATHTRFEHVLGVLGLAQTIIRSVSENFSRRTSPAIVQRSPSADDSMYMIAAPLNPHESRFTRLAALLHDIGHLPFGHSLEDELHLLNKHDKEHRLRLVLNFNSWDPDESIEQAKKASDWNFAEGSLGHLIDDKFKFGGLESEADPGDDGYVYLSSINERISPSQLVASIVLHEPVSIHRKKYESILKHEEIHAAYLKDLFESSICLRFGICADIVGNTICADLIDYLQRDWHHLGKSKFMEDRLFQYMEIACPAREKNSVGTLIADLPTEDRKSFKDKFVINLRSYPRLRTDAVSVILELLENRYNLAEAVLFHRTKLAGTALLERALSLGDPDLAKKIDAAKSNEGSGEYKNWEASQDGREPWSTELEQGLLQLSDDSFLENLITGSPPFKIPLDFRPVVSKLAKKVRRRSYSHNILTLSYEEGQVATIDLMQDLYSEHDMAPTNRELALRQLEADFGLELGDCAMYCPERRMNSKIAEVQVLIQGNVYKLEDYEKKSDGDLAGGHLTAQLRRFKRLWRVALYLDDEVQGRLQIRDEEWPEYQELISDYFRLYALGVSAPGKSLESERKSFLHRIWRVDGVFKRTKSECPVFKSVRDVEPDFDATTRKAARAEEIESKGSKFCKRFQTSGEFPNGQVSFWTLTKHN